MAAWWELLIAIGIPLGGSVAISALTDPPGDWYKSLNKPTWTPPNWAFPVVWTTLYILMGVASWLVWKKGGFEAQTIPLAVYIFQLLLNFLWTPLFFGAKRIGWAFYEIILMWLAIAATIVLFWGVSRTAALLLVPYIAWVSIATCLNLHIYKHNVHGGITPSSLSEPLHTADN